MTRTFETATEAYTYIMGKVSEANGRGDDRAARAWTAKITPAMREAYRQENTFVIATKANSRLG